MIDTPARSVGADHFFFAPGAHAWRLFAAGLPGQIPHDFRGTALRPTVFCYDSSAQIGPGGYHAFEARPGPVRCHAETLNSAEIEINASPGGVYYVKEQLVWGLMVGSPHLYPMDTPADADKARAEIRHAAVSDIGMAGALTYVMEGFIARTRLSTPPGPSRQPRARRCTRRRTGPARGCSVENGAVRMPLWLVGTDTIGRRRVVKN
jgi:hypothetical protein